MCNCQTADVYEFMETFMHNGQYAKLHKIFVMEYLYLMSGTNFYLDFRKYDEIN